MRRPLFGTGFPQLPNHVDDPLATPDDCLQVMDLRSLSAESQSYTRFIHLAVWAGGSDGGNVEVFIQVGSETPYLIGALSVTNSDRNFEFAIRGNVRVFVNQTADGAAVLFGYYQLQDEVPSIEVVRPLQPSVPVSPFTVAPLQLGSSDSGIVHSFEEGYTDIITLTYYIEQAVADTGQATFTFPNGVEVRSKRTSVISGQNIIMSGIPMLSDESGQTIEVSTPASITTLVVTGTFTRT